ncbi:MAG: hypothetical protein U0939_02160 [Pirellulales bacterium]
MTTSEQASPKATLHSTFVLRMTKVFPAKSRRFQAVQLGTTSLRAIGAGDYNTATKWDLWPLAALPAKEPICGARFAIVSERTPTS